MNELKPDSERRLWKRPTLYRLDAADAQSGMAGTGEGMSGKS